MSKPLNLKHLTSFYPFALPTAARNRQMDKLFAANDNKPGNQRSLMSVHDLQALANVPELVKGTLTAQSLITLYGAPGSGKSFIALDLAFSLATGKGWCGHDVEAGHVLYVVGEGGFGLHPRAKAWMKHHNVGIAPERLRFDLSEIDLFQEESVETFIKDIKRLYKKQVNAPLQLIIFDTLARTASTMDENSNRDMTRVIKNIGAIQRELRCAAMLVHHTGKNSGQERGASALRGASDTMMKVERSANDRISLTFNKQKDREDGLIYGFKKHVVDAGRGKSSLVFEHTSVRNDSGSTEAEKPKARAETDQSFLLELVTSAEGSLALPEYESAFLEYFLEDRGYPLDEPEAAKMRHIDSGKSAMRAARNALKQANLVAVDPANTISVIQITAQ